MLLKVITDLNKLSQESSHEFEREARYRWQEIFSYIDTVEEIRMLEFNELISYENKFIQDRVRLEEKLNEIRKRLGSE